VEAYHDHAKKATRKKSHCWRLRRASSLNGLGALAMGGLSVVILVAAYLAMLMCWSGGSTGSSEPGSASRMSFSLYVAISMGRTRG
jgi:hypothetical protein